MIRHTPLRHSRVCAWVRYALSLCPRYVPPLNHGREIRRSRWFRRGWTLQELLAPRKVVFYAVDWSVLGTRATLARARQCGDGHCHAVPGPRAWGRRRANPQLGAQPLRPRARGLGRRAHGLAGAA